MLTIAVRSVFEEDGKFYLQIFLDDCLHQMHQKSVIFVAFGILKILVIGNGPYLCNSVMIQCKKL